VVICLERGADLHIAQLMPLPLNVSCFSKIEIGFTFLVPAYPGIPGKGPLSGCVCVWCVYRRARRTGWLLMVVAGCRTEDGTSVSDRSVTRRRPSTEWTCGSVAATATLDEIPTEVRLLVIRSTQPCIPPGSLNRVSASAGVRAGMSPLPGGR